MCFRGIAAGGTREPHHGNPEHQLHPEVGLGAELEPGRDLRSGICGVGVGHLTDRAVAMETRESLIFAALSAFEIPPFPQGVSGEIPKQEEGGVERGVCQHLPEVM